MADRIQIRPILSSISGWTVLRAFFAGIVLGPFLFGMINGRDDYRTNLITEAMGIGFTVLVIDWIYELRANRDLKRRLVRESGSRSNDIAISAIEYLRDKRWLCGDDGLLQEANLAHANLKDVDLHNANLEKSNMFWVRLELAELYDANMQQTCFEGADMSGVSMFRADLKRAILNYATVQRADLRLADMRGAQFHSARMQGADLTGAFLEGAIWVNEFQQPADLTNATLPDGTRFSQHSDLDRFTNPENDVFQSTLAEVNKRRSELEWES